MDADGNVKQTPMLNNINSQNNPDHGSSITTVMGNNREDSRMMMGGGGPPGFGSGDGKFRRPLDQVTCFKCGEKGHYANKCPKGYLAFLSPALNNLKRAEPDS